MTTAERLLHIVSDGNIKKYIKQLRPVNRAGYLEDKCGIKYQTYEGRLDGESPKNPRLLSVKPAIDTRSKKSAVTGPHVPSVNTYLCESIR